jgi:hypothetical protein
LGSYDQPRARFHAIETMVETVLLFTLGAAVLATLYPLGLAAFYLLVVAVG